ncbi:TrbC family F-type conjugative pilus assembly protein [Xanthomonas perforans]|uniref:Conjugal transfer protein TraW n=1 Tax=Xanthomonas hortorum pv. gardneri TaxID=2754056 RepID=A0A6V7FI40_9XANT|nr:MULTISPECIES: TrbC family F-type conjugative pilus assembly protein [Xanthomonas]APP82550.1 hypothetical protein BJD10_22965 [Xanthomonas hortorum pv. gardneri]APR17969.1 hypothetical protein BI315_24105 [Xanthomonas citri pv. citri]APR22525.1 hypothetical protein BI316_23360 [Xanthomonas citri pv. citri]APR27349.1 hypothetical protein BJD09_24305 [Xanthomonas citri pv. citri]AUZ53631.1 hypothetical protein CLM98_24155 [Xanthomonas citri pv. citri]
MVVRQLVSLLLAAAFTPLSSLSAYAQQDASAVDIGTKAAEGKPADTFAHDLMTQSVEVLNNSAAYVGDANELMATEKVLQVHREQEAYFKSLLQAATSYNADAMNAAAVKYGLKPDSKKLEVEQGSGASKFRYRLHISWSMGDAAIRQALEYGLKYRESMVLSLRGPRPGEKLEPLIFAIVKLMGEVKEGSVVPNIEINPPSFTDNDVTVAPTLVVMNEQGQPIAKVAGVMNPEWVESEIEAGRRGDLGKHGQTSAIGEIDMMQAMIEKAKATDTKAMAERAKARIWQNLPMIPLPKTTVPRIRELDPGFYVTEDIPLPDGTFLARKGDYVNPLEDELMAFDDVIVIVDANDPEQVDFAAAVNSAYRSTGVITMLTDLDRSNGWDVIGRLTQRFKDQPFLLTSDVKERFRVERVPTVITVVDKKILVQEIPAESVKVKQ